MHDVNELRIEDLENIVSDANDILSTLNELMNEIDENKRELAQLQYNRDEILTKIEATDDEEAFETAEGIAQEFDDVMYEVNRL
jgi:hypothetical protein